MYCARIGSAVSACVGLSQPHLCMAYFILNHQCDSGAGMLQPNAEPFETPLWTRYWTKYLSACKPYAGMYHRHILLQYFQWHHHFYMDRPSQCLLWCSTEVINFIQRWLWGAHLPKNLCNVTMSNWKWWISPCTLKRWQSSVTRLFPKSRNETTLRLPLHVVTNQARLKIWVISY